MEALVIIDYTVDFVTGKLPVGEPAVRLEDDMVQLAEAAVSRGDYVVMAVDLHEENDPTHPETKLFPPHNIRGTEGRELYGKLRDFYEANRASVVWMDKTRYSAFHGTQLEAEMRERGIRRVHLAGVCTDICVLHTAVDAYNKGFDLVVHQKAVASFNPAGHDWALAHFTGSLGAEVID
jgi:nicotinamidase-related amidase